MREADDREVDEPGRDPDQIDGEHRPHRVASLGGLSEAKTRRLAGEAPERAALALVAGAL
jgi:hypothetical protein